MKYIYCSLLIGLFIFLSQIGVAQQSQFIEENGGIIHFRVFGDGTPVLIINGGPGMNSDGFSGLAEILGESYKAIIYDQRGTGRSELPEISSRSITLDLMVKDRLDEPVYQKLIIQSHRLYSSNHQ
ncbi:MAG: alpha/beta hydrolase [Balneola sp.]